jgi:hypothetical protein
MKPLSNFNPRWTGLLRKDSGEGVAFDCPACGPSHTLVAYFENPLDELEPAPWQNPKWHREGGSFFALTVKPSIEYPCWHGWVERGYVIDISESPLTLWSPSKKKNVAMSPLQLIEFGQSLIAKAEAAFPEHRDSEPSC